MDRQQILDLYDWADGICFRHPARGEVATAVVGVIHPQSAGEKEVRGCADCVIAMEDIRREQAARTGGRYTPGPVGERHRNAQFQAPGGSFGRGESGE